MTKNSQNFPFPTAYYSLKIIKKFKPMRPRSFHPIAFLSFIFLLSFADSRKQIEIGKAGYYADSLHGQKTASGDKYDKYEFTCAHKTLAFGTKIKVTRLDNNKSVEVRVNDRGPYVEGFVTDVSKAAAEKLNLIKIGFTKVKIEVVAASPSARVAAEADGNASLLVNRKPVSTPKLVANPVQYSNTDPRPATAAKSPPSTSNAQTQKNIYAVDIQPARKTGFGVQVGTLYDADNVLPMLKKLQQDWPTKALVSIEQDAAYHKTTYRVIIGPFTDTKSAGLQQKVAAKKGYKGCFVVDLNDM